MSVLRGGMSGFARPPSAGADGGKRSVDSTRLETANAGGSDLFEAQSRLPRDRLGRRLR